MESPPAGTVVLVSFPFSDLSRSKRRPALVLASVGRGDFVLCQITSNPYSDPDAIELTEGQFKEGSLQRISYVRPGKLFTAHEGLIEGKVGILSDEVRERVVGAVVDLLRGGGPHGDR